MKILYTAFKGINNSSKILLDKINCTGEDKLYLTNSFETSVKEFEKKVSNKNYDFIVSFGQLRLPVNTIKIETKGRDEESVYQTSFDYRLIKKELEEANFRVVVSDRTNYLCNNIYYHGLKMIYDRKLNCKMIFIHLPKVGNINVNDLAKIMEKIK